MFGGVVGVCWVFVWGIGLYVCCVCVVVIVVGSCLGCLGCVGVVWGWGPVGSSGLP